MAPWQNPIEEIQLEIINMNIVFLLLGLYGWEYFQSLDVEYAVIRGRLAFRWPLIPYLVGRLFLFIFLLLVALRTNPPSKDFSCLPGAMAIAISADIGLGCASTNLMIRTWVVWKNSRLVHILLLLFALGHWIVLALDVANFQGYQLNGECGINLVRPAMDATVFVYSLCYDFLVLVLLVVGLSRQSSKSSLRKRLHAQGLSYFVVAVITYIPPTIFSCFGVTYIVSLTGLSALTASTIASCRAVRSLLGLRPSHPSSTTAERVEDGVALSTQIPVQMTIPTSAA